MVTINESIEHVIQLLKYLEDGAGYAEFEDDLYSLLDALNEDKEKQKGHEDEGFICI